MKGVGGGKKQQTRGRITGTESGEMVGSEITKDCATLQFVLYPRTLRTRKMIGVGFWQDHSKSGVEWRMASCEKDCIYIIEV